MHHESGEIAYNDWTKIVCQRQPFNAKFLKKRKCDDLDADEEATNTLNSKVTSLLGPTLIKFMTIIMLIVNIICLYLGI